MKWFLLAVVVVAAVVDMWRRAAHTGRDRRLYELCEHAGLECVPLDPFGVTTWLPFAMFGRERQGVSNVIWDATRGNEIRAFDFWYEDEVQDEGRSPRHRLTCAVVPMDASVPPMRLAPRDLGEDLEVALGRGGVELELEAFNRRFAVETEDRRFAVAFLEQRMMEALLALPAGVAVELNEDVLLLSAPRLAPEEVLRTFDVAVEIHERMPRSLPSLYPRRPEHGPHEDRWLQGHWSPEPTAG